MQIPDSTSERQVRIYIIQIVIYPSDERTFPSQVLKDGAGCATGCYKNAYTVRAGYNPTSQAAILRYATYHGSYILQYEVRIGKQCCVEPSGGGLQRS